ncbi:hypothetical protein ACHAQJ_007426 [Trichoderma viride]
MLSATPSQPAPAPLAEYGHPSRSLRRPQAPPSVGSAGCILTGTSRSSSSSARSGGIGNHGRPKWPLRSSVPKALVVGIYMQRQKNVQLVDKSRRWTKSLTNI